MATEKSSLQRALADVREKIKEVGDVAEDELRGLLDEARTTGMERFAQLGTELVKLGHKLEKLGGFEKKPAHRIRVRVSPPRAAHH